MAEAYHKEALRKQRIIDKKAAAIARMKFGKVRSLDQNGLSGILQAFTFRFNLGCFSADL